MPCGSPLNSAISRRRSFSSRCLATVAALRATSGIPCPDVFMAGSIAQVRPRVCRGLTQNFQRVPREDVERLLDCQPIVAFIGFQPFGPKQKLDHRRGHFDKLRTVALATAIVALPNALPLAAAPRLRRLA